MKIENPDSHKGKKSVSSDVSTSKTETESRLIINHFDNFGPMYVPTTFDEDMPPKKPSESRVETSKASYEERHTFPGGGSGFFAPTDFNGTSKGGELIHEGKIAMNLQPAEYPWHNPVVRHAEEPKYEEIRVKSPPFLKVQEKFDWISIVFQPLGALFGVALLLVVMSAMGAAMPMIGYMLIGAVSGVMGVLWGVLRYNRQKKNTAEEVKHAKSVYEDYINELENDLSAACDSQKAELDLRHPAVAECIKLKAGDDLLWCRSWSDDDFLCLRLGTGELPNRTQIVFPEEKPWEKSELLSEAVRRTEKYRTIQNAPVVCDLCKQNSLGIVGDRSKVVDQCRSLLVSAVTAYNYEELKIVVVYPAEEKKIWEKLRFLPHVQDEHMQTRYIADNKDSAGKLLDKILAIAEQRKKKADKGITQENIPHYLVIVADGCCLMGTDRGAKLYGAKGQGVSSILLGNTVKSLPMQCESVIRMDYENPVFDGIEYSMDKVNWLKWDAFLTRMAPIRLQNPSVVSGIPERFGFFEGWNIQQPEDVDLGRNWSGKRADKSLKVPVGVDHQKKTVYFDIRDPNVGPHGIFIGQSTWGKSSMARAWMLSMAMSYPPEQLGFVLIDFKPPGLFESLEKLPHVVGTLGILDKDLVQNFIALNSEIKRRKIMFTRAGVLSFRDYCDRHRMGKPGAEEPMPYLIIVVDELNQFKKFSSEASGDNWMKLLDGIYETGAALGMSILSGSQTSGPFTPVMMGNSQFSWFFKVKEEADSRHFIGSEALAKIVDKGRAYMKIGSHLTQMQPMFADQPFYTAQQKPPELQMALISMDGTRTTVKQESGAPTEMEKMVDYIVEYTRREHIPVPRKIWPERLPEYLRLDELQQPEQNRLRAVTGLVYDPYSQSRYPLELELTRTGSFILMGCAVSGKTSFLRTFAYSMMTSNSPEILDTYIVEGKTSEFASYAAFPHVRRICPQHEGAQLISQVFSIMEMRTKKGRVPGERNILLILDNLNFFMDDLDCKKKLSSLFTNGAGNGIYLVASAALAIGVQSVFAMEGLTTFGLCYWISSMASDYRDNLHTSSVESIPPMNVKGRGIVNAGHTLSFQTAMADGLTKEKISAISRKLWGDTGSRPGEEMLPQLEEGSVLIGHAVVSGQEIVQDCFKNPSLLVVCDDVKKRYELIRSLAEQLTKETGMKALTGVDVPDSWKIPELIHLDCGKELDDYLDDMRPELQLRLKNQPENGNHFPPYVFLMPDFYSMEEQCSQVSLNRIDKNLLLNAAKFSVITVAGCSYQEYGQLLHREEKLIAMSGGTGKETVPFKRLSLGRTLLVGVCHQNSVDELTKKYNFPHDGDYYAGSAAEEIVIYRE